MFLKKLIYDKPYLQNMQVLSQISTYVYVMLTLPTLQLYY
jgi:hypothetical protein